MIKQVRGPAPDRPLIRLTPKTNLAFVKQIMYEPSKEGGYLYIYLHRTLIQIAAIPALYLLADRASVPPRARHPLP